MVRALFPLADGTFSGASLMPLIRAPIHHEAPLSWPHLHPQSPLLPGPISKRHHSVGYDSNVRVAGEHSSFCSHPCRTSMLLFFCFFKPHETVLFHAVNRCVFRSIPILIIIILAYHFFVYFRPSTWDHFGFFPKVCGFRIFFSEDLLMGRCCVHLKIS